MKEKVIIIRWSEIHLKGKNRHYFEKLLYDNIKNSLREINVSINRIDGRYLIENFSENEQNKIINKLNKISGIHTISIAIKVENDIDKIAETSIELCKNKKGTFKVETKRADKKFTMHSLEVSRFIGGCCLKNNSNLEVDVHNPDFVLNIDIRDSGNTLIFTDIIKMMGGMPCGSSGKGLLMISGGIDSPVAGYMMAKRGMKLDMIHFHSYPYTSEGAKQKVVKLAKKVAEYSGGGDLFVISFTEIQEKIHENCPEEFMITIMRRFMMRIAERLAKNCHAQTIITGESLGQVASQTIESITSSNSVVNSMPVLRPLIAFDKIEIIDIAEKIDTFETSILPFEDCCTVFLPKFPVIKPRLLDVLSMESKLNVEELIDNVFKNIEKIKL